MIRGAGRRGGAALERSLNSTPVPRVQKPFLSGNLHVSSRGVKRLNGKRLKKGASNTDTYTFPSFGIAPQVIVHCSRGCCFLGRCYIG